MKMTKLFTTVFDEELISRGFKRKAKLYYRLNGDILQGVIIKTINPYTIHFYSAPYWMENIQAKLSPLHKGYWAEHGWCISPGGGAYYREENENLNLDYMSICLALAKEYIFPILDKMNNIDSYIENCVPNWTTMRNEVSRNDVIVVNPWTIDEKYSHIDTDIKMLWRVWDELFTYNAFLYKGYTNNNLKCGYEILNSKAALLPFHTNRDQYAQNKYMEFMTDDGLSRAKQYFEERRAIMIPRLRDELGLDTFNL